MSIRKNDLREQGVTKVLAQMFAKACKKNSCVSIKLVKK